MGVKHLCARIILLAAESDWLGFGTYNSAVDLVWTRGESYKDGGSKWKHLRKLVQLGGSYARCPPICVDNAGNLYVFCLQCCPDIFRPTRPTDALGAVKGGNDRGCSDRRYPRARELPMA